MNKDFQKGQWEARVLIRDKKENRSMIVNADISAEKNARMRLDLATTLGVHVASLAVVDKNATYIVPNKKVFYSGPVSSSIFKPILNISFDPKLLNNILFDLPVSGWNCKKEKNNLKECVRSSDNLLIAWALNAKNEKIVSVRHSDYELEMKFTYFKEKSELKESLFQIKKPEDFKSI